MQFAISYLASEELSSVNTLMEMVNGLEQFRKLESESVLYAFCLLLTIDMLRLCSRCNFQSSMVGQPCNWYSGTLTKKEMGIRKSESSGGYIAYGRYHGEQGRKGEFDRLYSSYIRFERELNDATKEEMPRSIKTMLRAQCRLLKLVKKELVDWQKQLRKANSHAYNALQIAEGLDMNMAEYDSLQPLPDAEQ